MTEFMQWFSQMLLGELGRPILDFVRANFLMIFSGIFLYGLLLTYARFIHKNYLPKKLKEYIDQHSHTIDGNTKNAAAIINTGWEKQLDHMPWYIVVPTKNELWIKSPNIDYRLTKQLPFRKEKSNMNDYDWIQFWLKEKEV